MKEYVLISLDDDNQYFSVICEAKKSIFKRKQPTSKLSYTDLITGEVIQPKTSEAVGLTYSIEPKTISREQAARFLFAIKSIGANSYADHIMELKERIVKENTKGRNR